jgi:hypothetical protein
MNVGTSDLTTANTECKCELFAANAGFHSTSSAQQAQNTLTQAIAAATALTLATNAAANAANVAKGCSHENPNTTDYSGWHYCWTHGLGNNPNHASSKCTRPAEGHKMDAILDNMLGGNTRIQRHCQKRADPRNPP